MKNKNIPNFNAPLGFKEILHDFAKVVLKFQPKDLIEFGADYFESLNEGRLLENDPKYKEPQIKKQQDILKKEEDLLIKEDLQAKVKEMTISEIPPAKHDISNFQSINTQETNEKSNMEENKEYSLLEWKPHLMNESNPESTSFINQHSVSKNENSMQDQKILISDPRNAKIFIIDKENINIENNNNFINNFVQESKINTNAKNSEKKQDGILKINVINLRGEELPRNLLVSLKLLNYPDPKELFTRVIHDNQTPEWYFRGKMNLNSELIQPNLLLSITLNEKKKNELIEIASKQIELNYVFENDSKWAINNYFELIPSNSQISSPPPLIYLQLRWLLRNKIYSDYDSEPVDINVLEKTIIKPILRETFFQGFLSFNIIKARNLRSMDNVGELSDPYCEFWFSHKRNEKDYTISILQNLNPVWNEKRIFNLNDLKINQTETVKLMICVWDQDQVGEDFLGGVSFDLRGLLEVSGYWLNGWFKLSDDNNKQAECGDIYIQLCYFNDANEKPNTPEIAN